MGKLNGITASEKLTLMLDGELDPLQEQELMAEIEANPELQEEMDQLISIREAIITDTEAFTPPAAVTSSVFSSIGYMAPASIGSSAAVSTITPLVQSFIIPVLSALLISGGTFIFTQRTTDGIFMNSGETTVQNTVESTGNDTEDLSDATAEDEDSSTENDIPVSSSSSIANDVSASPEPFSDGREAPSEPFAERLRRAEPTQSQSQSNIANADEEATKNENISLASNITASERENTSQTESSNIILPFNQEKISPSRLYIPRTMQNRLGFGTQLPNAPSYGATPSWQPPREFEDRTTGRLVSVNGADIIGAEAKIILGKGFNLILGGYLLDNIQNITEVNSPITQDPALGLGFEWSAADYIITDLSEGIYLYPSIRTEAMGLTSYILGGTSILGNIDFEDINLSTQIGYRLGYVILDSNTFTLNQDILPMNGIILSVGLNF